MYYAANRFTGVIAGAEKVFEPGAPITDAEAKELDLANKPGLATKTKPEVEVAVEAAKP